jgi:hypothetical protein
LLRRFRSYAGTPIQGQTLISGKNSRIDARFSPGAQSVWQEFILTPRRSSYTESGRFFLPLTPGELNMTAENEQIMLNTLKTISLDIKMLIVIVRELNTQQDAASQKAYTQLVNIAHKRV